MLAGAVTVTFSKVTLSDEESPAALLGHPFVEMIPEIANKKTILFIA
jgi:hypothetical protein